MNEIVYRGLVLVPVSPGHFAKEAWETMDGAVRLERSALGVYLSSFKFGCQIWDTHVGSTYQESLDLGIEQVQDCFEDMERFFSVLV